MPSMGLAQEYKSSIRTMGEDITSLKSGQKPSGVDIPRKVTPEAPKPAMPGASKQETPPSGPMSFVGLGGTEKTGPLAGLPKPPVFPSRPGSTSDLGQAGKTGPLPPPPGSSIPFKPPGPFKAPEIQPSMTVPSEKKGLSAMFYLLIAGILVIGGVFYWFYLRPMESEIVPSPIPTATPTPVIKNLNEIFAGVPVNFDVSLSESVSSDFKTFANTLTVVSGEFVKINLVQDLDGTLVSLNFLDMFDMASTVYPSALRNSITDSAMLVFSQVEIFKEDGTIDFDTTQNLKKTVFMARVMDMSAVELMMKDWELTIAEDLGDYLLIEDTSEEESVNFLNNTYRGVSIRYKNFPFPDITVDYAVVEAAGQNYLIIASSREAMYAAIDVLSP
ncbi:MAG: hypothetical protein HY505_01130 [Candidatus Yanofskybacteria bacterium]|nr:hypothetical protein [Candidatus Yanofskybacteria bacterium]